MKKRWTNQELLAAIQSSFSYRQTIKKLGLVPAGGNYSQLKKYVEENGYDISHFRGKGWNKGLVGIGRPRIPLEKVLVQNSYFQSYKLKKRLFSSKLKPEHCEVCGWSKRTDDGYLPLELDHINGDHYDNRIENLRILCPNCHSLTHTHRGKNKKKNARVVEWYTRNT